MTCRCLNCITPPYVLERLLENNDVSVREAALKTLLVTERLRGIRSVNPSMFGVSPSDGRRTVFDCENRPDTQRARIVRTETDGPVGDVSADRAFDGLGLTRDFYMQVLRRNSIDGYGMPLEGYVHYDTAYNNAFWDGRRMVFGDGDGELFTDFTGSIDVIAHELTHGVIEHSAGLVYSFQPGALNESIADVFGSLVKQWSLRQTAEEADWLIGAEIFTPAIPADALRSMKQPGTAFDDPVLGKDPQPDHMSKFVVLPESEDNGGVHINSGIPNRAFYLAATNIGGHAWEAAGHIWYEALLASNDRTEFQAFADTTFMKAGQLYGPVEQQAVREAWQGVGLTAGGGREMLVAGVTADESLSALRQQIADLSQAVEMLTKQVSGRTET